MGSNVSPAEWPSGGLRTPQELFVSLDLIVGGEQPLLDSYFRSLWIDAEWTGKSRQWMEPQL